MTAYDLSVKYSWNNGPHKRYELVKNALDFNSAYLAALDAGGYLAEIDSPEENLHIYENVISQMSIDDLLNTLAFDGGGSAYLWLGGSDSEHEDDWKWLDTRENIGILRPEWGSGALGQEPDNYNDQDGLAMGLENWPYGYLDNEGFGNAGSWNDVDIDNQLFYVIEYDIAIEGSPPLLNIDASPQFFPVLTNSLDPSGAVGTLVSALIDSGGVLDNFIDADSDSPAIAIVGTNLNGGGLYYSTNNGADWSDVGAVSENSARVLYADSDTRLAFIPPADFSGTINDLITFKGWDRNGAVNGAVLSSYVPQLLASFDTFGKAWQVSVSSDGKTAFIADGENGLQIIDVRNNNNPLLVSSLATSDEFECIALSVDESIAFIADSENGLQIIDISDTANPLPIANIDTPGYAAYVTLSENGNTAFIADRTGGLTIIDVSDPINPSLAVNYEIPGDAFQVALSSEGNTAFIASDDAGLQIIDVSDPASPRLISTYETTSAVGITLSPDSNIAYLAADELHIIDISNPFLPSLIGKYETKDLAWDVAISADGNTAIVADGETGLQFVDVTDPVRPLLSGSFNTPGKARGVTLSDDGKTAFVADIKGGMQIIDLSQLKYSSPNSDTAIIQVVRELPEPSSKKQVNRLYNSLQGKHLFSSNQYEIDLLTGSGWDNEGVIYNAPADSTADVFRFYIPAEGCHFYTALESERDFIIGNQETFSGWDYEGPAFSAYSTSDFPEGAVAVVRYLNQETGSHIYSTSTFEQGLLDQDSLWLNEGIAWYGDPMA